MQSDNPTAAILVIGDEILSGRTREGNAHHLAQVLSATGFDLREIRVVSDDHDRIVAAVRALDGSLGGDYDLLFTSGGIGPTHDDITADAVADALKVLSDSGVPVYFIRGNRDFLLGEDYARRAGLRIRPSRARGGGSGQVLAGGPRLDQCRGRIEIELRLDAPRQRDRRPPRLAFARTDLGADLLVDPRRAERLVEAGGAEDHGAGAASRGGRCRSRTEGGHGCTSCSGCSRSAASVQPFAVSRSSTPTACRIPTRRCAAGCATACSGGLGGCDGGSSATACWGWS